MKSTLSEKKINKTRKGQNAKDFKVKRKTRKRYPRK